MVVGLAFVGAFLDLDLEVIGADLVEVRGELALERGAEGEDRDDGGNADDDAQQRE